MFSGTMRSRRAILLFHLCSTMPPILLSEHYIYMNIHEYFITPSILLSQYSLSEKIHDLDIIIIPGTNRRKQSADSRSEKCALLHGHRGSASLKAFVVWKGKLYAIFKGVNSVDEYMCQPPFEFKRTIPVEGMKNPVDIASCSKFNCLYVTDADVRCVWKISFSRFRAIGDITKIISDVEFPSTLKISVTPIGKLVLVEDCELADGNMVSRGSVNIYDENGTPKKIYHIPAGAGNESLKHAVLNNHDRFVVSFGGRLGILDKLENITARYPISGSPAFDKEEAWHVVIDDHDRTFLTNFKNREIIVLDKDLHELFSLDISTAQLEDTDPPICYTVHMDKIYIGLLSGNILVKDVKAGMFFNMFTN